MPKKSIIRTEKLCKSFSSGGVMQHVIKNLDTEIYEGDFTVIMGSSGAGKSTLLYALSGMDNNLFVSQYMLQLPDKKELENAIDFYNGRERRFGGI